MVWTSFPKSGQLLAIVYVRNGMYSISTFGLGGLEPKAMESLEDHLVRSLKLTKRTTN